MIEVSYEKDGQQRKNYYYGIWLNPKTRKTYTFCGSLFMDWDFVKEINPDDGGTYAEVRFNLASKYKVSIVS